MSDELKMFGTITLVVVGVVAGIVFLAATIAEKSCQESAGAMAVNHRFSIWTDCMIEVKGRWVPLKAYREFAEPPKASDEGGRS